jgi:hypothetical protein
MLRWRPWWDRAESSTCLQVANHGRDTACDRSDENEEGHPSGVAFAVPKLWYHYSRGGTRTPDPVINSHLLYHLSYSGRSPES